MGLWDGIRGGVRARLGEGIRVGLWDGIRGGVRARLGEGIRGVFRGGN